MRWDILTLKHINKSVNSRMIFVPLNLSALELTQTLINASQTVTIQWSSGLGGPRQKRRRITAPRGISICCLAQLFADQPADVKTKLMAAAMGHEGFHAVEAIEGDLMEHNTAANEAFAYSFGYQVALRLGCESDFVDNVQLSGEFKNINPFMNEDILNKQIKAARYILFNYLNSTYFRGIGTLTSWPGMFGRGRDKFLSVAESVWWK